jgi:hypothetical protein
MRVDVSGRTNEHMLTCQSRSFSCPRCDASIKAGDAKQHAELECLIRVSIPPQNDEDNPKRKLKRDQDELLPATKKHRFAAHVHLL